MDIGTVFKFATEYGIFPVLFVMSFVFMITEYKGREKAQRVLYEKLSEDVSEIRNRISSIEESSKRTDANIGNTSKSVDDINQDLTELKFMITSLESIIKLFRK